MDYVGLESLKSAYVEELAENGEVERAGSLAVSEITDPVFAGFEVHPEEEPNIVSLNSAFEDIAVDLYALNAEIRNAVMNYNQLIADTDFQLSSADELLQVEEDRIKDMNIICGNYQEFTMVKTLTPSDFNGTFGQVDNKVFTCPSSKPENVDLEVLQVSGNGYEGNGYVKKDAKTFLSDTVIAENRDNIIDNSNITHYDYSRLTSTGEKEYPAEVNFDTEEAACSITLAAGEPVSAIQIESPLDNIVVRDVLTSNDGGASFTSHMVEPLPIHNHDAKYSNSMYVFNSGILAFPSSKYIRVMLESGGATTEQLAYRKIDTTDAANPKGIMVDLPNTKRHVIRLNNISASSSRYFNKAQFRSNELITSPVQSIAIFASEYIPPHYPENDNYIQYILTINGSDYQVVPINGYKRGTKIIRSTQHSVVDHYVVKLDESIKSARLTVIMQTPEQDSTPYLSNLKVCLGKAEVKS